MEPDHAALLAESERTFIIAPAGTGKTWTIAAAVAKATKQDRPQLVLTHTHAGVHAIRKKLSSPTHNIPSKACEVDTIAGWALRYVVAYPKMAGLTDVLPYPTKNWVPSGNEWKQVYEGAARLATKSTIKDVIRVSYSGLYVDEYQDCSESQHSLIVALADLVPCRILGDPLQGIYDFGNETLVDMSVLPKYGFTQLPGLNKPYRWEKKNPDLGEWLLNVVRPTLERGGDLDLKSLEGIWTKPDGGEYKHALQRCRNLLSFTSDSVVAIRGVADQCHEMARNLSGHYQSIEPNQSDDLIYWCSRLESEDGPQLAATVLEFAGTCMTEINTKFKSVRIKFKSGELPNCKLYGQTRPPVIELCELARSPSLAGIMKALQMARKHVNGRVFRQEILKDFQQAVSECCSGRFVSLVDAATFIRMRRNQAGRPIPRHVVSRTLLVKGLEFDHAVVLLSGAEDIKNLYVAMTRGSRSLTVVAPSSIIKPGKKQTNSNTSHKQQKLDKEYRQGILEFE